LIRFSEQGEERVISGPFLKHLAQKLEKHTGVARKRPVGDLLKILHRGKSSKLPVDDCGVILDDGGYLLFTADSLQDWLLEDPYFAGFCGVNVVVNDIYAMGGVPRAVVDSIYMIEGEKTWLRLLGEGMRDACEKFNVVMSGGHLDPDAGFRALSVSGIGKAERVMSTFDAEPGDAVMFAFDLNGKLRGSFPIWDSSTGTEEGILRRKYLELVKIAEEGLATACRDISNAGCIGTLGMMMEASQTAAWLDLAAIPVPNNLSLEEWIFTYPSYGFILTVPLAFASSVENSFRRQGIAAVQVGRVVEGRGVTLVWQGESVETYSSGIIF